MGGRPWQWLSDLSQDVRNALKAKVTSQAAGDQDDWSRREVLKLTLEEVKQGWASGPFAEQELDDRLGRGWVPSHRFGLVSAGKFRLIDDFSGSLVNATVTCKEQVRVDGVDRTVAVVKLWSRLLAGNNDEVALTTGEVHRGTRHAGLLRHGRALWKNATIWRPRTSSVHWRMRKTRLVL